MSGYHGRAGPNFSQYINNLNTIPPYEQEPQPVDEVDFAQDLAMFTNAEFNDFDSLNGMPGNMQNGLPFDLNDDNAKRQNGDNQNMKFQDMLAGDAVPFYPEFTSPIMPMQPGPNFSHASSTSPTNASSPVSPQASSSNPTGLKRKIDSATDAPHPHSVEEQTRLAAEEDKRRRNTAASARFRVKKKQREQALEKTVKEVSDKNAMLEARMNQLEMENKWLKNLITEKNGSKSEGDIAEMYRKYKRDSEERDSRKSTEHKDGVGTKK